MESKKHTPGPWEFCGAGEIRSMRPVKRIASVEDGGGDSRVTAEEYGENALLVAAAPTMYKEILETMGRLNTLLADPRIKKHDDLMTAIGTTHMDLNRAAAIADGSWPVR